MPAKLLRTARLAARAGADILERLLDQEHRIDQKGFSDFVTEADLQSEKAILDIIREAHPDHGILAEESSGKAAWEKARRGFSWVVDPLDGTTNYIHRYPAFAVSVAVLKDGQPLAGVVIDVARKEEFWASKDGGAFSGEQRISVSRVSDPAAALFLTGFPVRQKHRIDQYLGAFKELFGMSSGVRRAGAAALDMAWVAAGRGDGFFEMGLSPWDLAAGRILVEEAGGRVSDFSGSKDNFLWTGEHIASNGLLHEIILASCARHLAPAKNNSHNRQKSV